MPQKERNENKWWITANKHDTAASLVSSLPLLFLLLIESGHSGSKFSKVAQTPPPPFQLFMGNPKAFAEPNIL